MKRLLKICIAVVSALLAICLVVLIMYFINVNQSQKLIDNTVRHTISVDENNQKVIDWNELSLINSDIVAWLEIPNTDIDCPIVQYENNTYYLRRGLNKSYSFAGVNFFDCNNSLDMNDDNTIIYGHNLRDNNNFGQLPRLYNSIEKVLKNKYINTYFPDKTIKYAVVGAFYTNSKPSDDNGYVFPYNVTNMSDEHFEEFIDELNQRFLYSSEIVSNDKLLMLSTCTYEFKDERFVVVAKQINDISEFNYISNPAPRYPQKWYDKKGKANPYTNAAQWNVGKVGENDGK